MPNPSNRKPKAASAAARKPSTRGGKTPSRNAKVKPINEARTYVVFGVATYADSTPAPGMFVIAYDRDLAGNDTLGKATTDAAGNFSIRYGDADYVRSKNERGGADVVVRVYNDKQELLFTSKKKNNAPALYELNITLPAPAFVVRGIVSDANQKPLAKI